MTTRAIFFPFDLFGSPGTRAGAELARRRLRGNAGRQSPGAHRHPGPRLRRAGPLRGIQLQHASRLPGLAQGGTRNPSAPPGSAANSCSGSPAITSARCRFTTSSAPAEKTLVIQLDAHLDIFNLRDCTKELSHGNFLLHAERPLPSIVNVGQRELLLRPEYIKKYYLATFPAADLAPMPLMPQLRAVDRGGRARLRRSRLRCLRSRVLPGRAVAAPVWYRPALAATASGGDWPGAAARAWRSPNSIRPAIKTTAAWKR